VSVAAHTIAVDFLPATEAKEVYFFGGGGPIAPSSVVAAHMDGHTHTHTTHSRRHPSRHDRSEQTEQHALMGVLLCGVRVLVQSSACTIVC
jgi:hypothetical protein